MRHRAQPARMGIMALALVLLLAGVGHSVVPGGQEKPKPSIIPGIVTVVFEDHVELGAVARGFGAVRFGIPSFDNVLDGLEVSEARCLFPWHQERPLKGSGRLDPTRYYELSFPESMPVERVIETLMQNPNVKLAEPVWALPLQASPDDPLWSSQWAMEPPPPDPDFYDAWDIETGSDSIKYGCIDSGVQYKHPDLKDHIWVNPGEDIDGDLVVYDLDDLNGVDDDGNGVTDDLIGYDFLTSAGHAVWPGEDGGGVDPDPWDFDGHGTHVAGIAAEMTNNVTGGAGIAGGWHGGNRAFRGVQIMCIRVGYLASDGLGYVNSNNCGTAISYASNNGADVINCSWGSLNTSTMQVGMQDARDNSVTVTHAAGNDNADDPDYLDFDPYTTVLSVASVTSSDVKSSFSNYGTWVDVSAPGSDIYSTYSNFGAATYISISGTSMAAPMVAGLALLIRSAMPSLTKEQVDSLIISTADNIDSLQNPLYQGKMGSGRINAYKALIDLANAKFAADVTEGEAPLVVNFTDLSPDAPNPPGAWWWSFGTGDSAFVQNPSYTYNDPGVYSVSLLVDQGNPLGLGEEHLKNYIWVKADTILLDSVERQLGEMQVVMPVYLASTAPVSDIQFAFQFTNSNNVGLDSVSTVGLRTEYFYSVGYSAHDPSNERFAVLLASSHPDSSHYLPPDTGAILKLYISTPYNADPSVITVDTATVSGKSPYVATIWGDFWPQFSAGKIVIPFCERGDVDCNGQINIADLTLLVDYLFRGGGPIDPRGGDVDGSGGINVADITYLVAYLFQGGPPPPP
ncbi:MAG: S8 family serine peptidase [Candidatus Zixiibacteriota bacterium]